jgi:hypothetical protein
MICYDIFENVCQYLSIDDIISFFLMNKECYGIYKYNKRNCNIIFVEKIFSYFNIMFDDYKDVYKYESSTCTLLKMYNYFINHKSSCKADLLIYMVDNNVYNIDLFRLIISKCIFRKVFMNDDNYDDNSRILNLNYSDVIYDNSLILLSDMKYLLVYTNSEQLDVILKTFDIPLVLLSYIIRDRLFSNRYKYNTDSNKCLKVIILYLFVKNCYGSFNLIDNIHVHSILTSLIRYKKTDVFKYFLYNKNKYIVRGFGLDYPYLINKCVEMQDKIHLDLLIRENKKDNDKVNLNKSYVIINIDHITNHCRNGRFKYLEFLVNKYLGDMINTKMYIQSICNGIREIILSNKTKKLLDFDCLKAHISDVNIEYLNNYIYDLYTGIKLCETKRIFL